MMNAINGERCSEERLFILPSPQRGEGRVRGDRVNDPCVCGIEEQEILTVVCGLSLCAVRGLHPHPNLVISSRASPAREREL